MPSQNENNSRREPGRYYRNGASGQQRPRQPAAQRPRASTSEASVQGAASQGNEPLRRPPVRNGRRRRPRVRYRWFRALVMVMAVVVFSGFLAMFILESASDWLGLNQVDEYFDVVIPEDADITLVTGILADAGVINQALAFQFYAMFRFGDDYIIQPGEYVFNSNMGYDQILQLLRRGTWRDNIVRITFHEGMTLNDIANVLHEYGVVDRDVFIEFLNTAELDYDFIRDIPYEEEHLRFHRLEGFIFPDTYDFYVPERVDSVARKFLDNFDRRITADMYRRMDDLGMTLHETIILASIIQREADFPGNMRRVSSVFHNRLNNPGMFPRLEADVTILYVENDIRPYIGEINQEMFDAYNTYVRVGLPVGPITNPGLEAIMAALYPSDTNFYFFITDHNLQFHFAETLWQHEENIRIWEAEMAAAEMAEAE